MTVSYTHLAGMAKRANLMPERKRRGYTSKYVLSEMFFADTAKAVSYTHLAYEPYLMQIGFLSRTPKGRIVTSLAYKHLGLTPPEDNI